LNFIRIIHEGVKNLLIMIILVGIISGCQKKGIRPQSFSVSKAEHKPNSVSNRSKGPAPVLLIGSDGMDLEIVKELVAAGQMPTFAKIMQSGAHGVLLSEREMRSPPLWTTIATGRPRSVHQIYDFITGSRFWPKKYRSKKRKIVTSRMRRVPALWNIASQFRKKVVVVGWLNTWPAEQINGVMVSPYVALGEWKQITIKGAVYPDEPHQVYPENLWRKIHRMQVSDYEVPEELVRDIAPEPGDLLIKFRILDQYMRGLRWSLAHTLTMKKITLYLLEKENPDLTLVYFEGCDSLGHRFWLFRQPEHEIARQLKQTGYPTEQVGELSSKYGKVLDGYYRFFDKVVGDLIAAQGPGGYVMVISDHGFMDLAKKHSEKNPVYYIQYVHARICRIFEQAGMEMRDQSVTDADAEQLSNVYEKNILKLLGQYPEIVSVAAFKLSPHIIVNYLRDLANAFHSFYDKKENKVLIDNIALRNARLKLIYATKIVIQNGLTLLDVSAPQKM